MHVAVGSTNPVKAEATECALGNLPGTVDGVAVDSGVPEQPRGIEQTVAGADNRARRALDAGGYDFGVGIEGGVAEFPGLDGLFLVVWASVTDGDRVGRGGGPDLPLPEGIAGRVRDGEELGPVMDDVLDRDGVKRQEGAAGVLTDGNLDRVGALEAAVAGALGPFVVDRFEW